MDLLHRSDEESKAFAAQISRSEGLSLLQKSGHREEYVHLCIEVIKRHQISLLELEDLTLPSNIIQGLETELGFYHSFLWFAWHHVRQFGKKGEIHSQLDNMVVFLSTALDGLLALEHDDNDFQFANCCQLSYDLGNYYWLKDDYANASVMVQRAIGLANIFDLDENKKRIDFTISKLQNILKVCAYMHTPSKNGVIFMSFESRNYSSSILFDALLQDAIDNKVSLIIKRLMVQDALKTDPKSASIIALMNAFAVSIDILSNKDERGSNRVTIVQREMLKIDFAVLLQYVEAFVAILPSNVLDECLTIWQVILYMQSLEQKQEYENLWLMKSFNVKWPSLLYSSPLQIDKAVPNDKASISYQVYLRKLILTSITNDQLSHIPDFINLLPTLGFNICPFLLDHAESCYTKKHYVAAISLISVLEQTRIQDNSLQTRCRHFQLLSVLAALAEKVENLPSNDPAVSLYIDQFLTIELSVRSYLTKAPPSVEIFARVISVIVQKDHLEKAINYTERACSNLSYNSTLATSINNLGGILLLIGQIELMMFTQEIVNRVDLVQNVTKLDGLSAEVINGYCDAGRQIAGWMTNEGDFETSKVVRQGMINFITKARPSMAAFVIGVLAGLVNRSLPADLRLSYSSQNVFSLFTIEQPDFFWDKNGLPSLKGMIDLSRIGVLGPKEIDQTLLFMKEYCESQNIKTGFYGDICFARGENKAAIKAYVDGVLEASRFLKRFDDDVYSYFPRLAQTLIKTNDTISACILLQFVRPTPAYDFIFFHLKTSHFAILNTLSDPVFDPPSSIDASLYYGFFDVHVIEYLISTTPFNIDCGKSKDENAVLYFINRLQKPCYQDSPEGKGLMVMFQEKILNWFIQKLATSLSL